MQGKNKTLLLDEIGRDEGFRAKPYKCSADKLTIGYGLNLEEGITKEEGRWLLDQRARRSIGEAETFPWYDTLSPARKRVVVNMLYNLGIARFKKFKKSIRYIAVGDYGSASTEMLDSAWANQVGPRATRLSKMMKNG